MAVRVTGIGLRTGEGFDRPTKTALAERYRRRSTHERADLVGHRVNSCTTTPMASAASPWEASASMARSSSAVRASGETTAACNCAATRAR